MPTTFVKMFISPVLDMREDGSWSYVVVCLFFIIILKNVARML